MSILTERNEMKLNFYSHLISSGFLFLFRGWEVPKENSLILSASVCVCLVADVTTAASAVATVSLPVLSLFHSLTLSFFHSCTPRFISLGWSML